MIAALFDQACLFIHGYLTCWDNLRNDSVCHSKEARPTARWSSLHITLPLAGYRKMSSILVYGVALLFYTTLKTVEDHRLRQRFAQLLEEKKTLDWTDLIGNHGTRTHRNPC